MKKESFILYKSFYKAIAPLSLEDKGRLFEAIFKYQNNKRIRLNSKYLRSLFAFFENQFRIDEKKYQNRIKKFIKKEKP